MSELAMHTHLQATFASERVFIGGRRVAEPPLIPHRAIFVNATGGPPPRGYMDGGARTVWKASRIQIIVRGNPREYASTKTLADAVWSACWAAPVEDFHVRCEQSEPVSWGRDSVECNEFSIHVRMERKVTL